VPRGAKAGHVGAGLGDDDLRGGLANPGHGDQQVTPSGGTTGPKSLVRVLTATIDSSCRWPPAPY
jgi:hypothetical protein